MGQGSHLFRKMWGVESRRQNHKGDVACWDRDRFDGSKVQDAETYFSDLLRGTHCSSTNWYEGSNENHGFFQAGDAPALLGYDQDIERFCEWSCDQHNLNILNMFGAARKRASATQGGIQYNQCRNFEWQMCAANGYLNQQASRKIIFAHAPKRVRLDQLDGSPAFGQCSGYSDKACDGWAGFANDDIYPLEVCLFSLVCQNDHELFEVDAGEPFVCEIDVAGFRDLQSTLTRGSST